MKSTKNTKETSEELDANGERSTPSFEEATRELEEIVQALENGQVPLGESLKLVQRGRELSDACAQMLNEAELTLSQLAATSEGELVEEELDWDGE